MSVEPQRRSQLVEATITEIGMTGSLNVTVGQIAKRAGVSAALAFHYFGDKDQLFLAAMRHILTIYGAEVRGALAAGASPRDRLNGLIRASFSPTNFRRDVIAAWLNFYVLARRADAAKRLLAIYHSRLQSNLVHDLRPLVGADAADIAQRIGGLIDGLYLRNAINPEVMTGKSAAAHVLAALEREIGECK
ncbi:choline-binding transcriptional repressor BetI [Anianabacter salinae]|uniref:choline-binding transcriptional repressor BetI n=1 Tax=Anianabacter salinae TaxID=2851023 RepID=UPI00225E3B01|nr:transcriptional regulator BetI [Anianabacter salinae]MBV0912399.1 transcriptional regulator BetI [Anianabacter salinae]